MEADVRKQLLEFVKREAVRHGQFTLASGATSSFYIDCRMVTLHPEGAYLAARAILEKIATTDATAVGGPPRAADPIAAAVAVVSRETGRPLRAFMVRKEPKKHGMSKMVEGPVKEGERVVIVEDTVTTGGSIFQAIREVEKMGCEVAKVVSIVDRGTAGEALAREGYDYDPIFTLEDLGLA